MERAPERRVRLANWTRLLVLTWACVVVPTPQGLVPLGLRVFFAPRYDDLGGIGWLGVAMLLVLTRRRRTPVWYGVGIACLLAGWWIGAGSAEPLSVTSLTSVPFLLLAAAELRHVIAGRERAEARRDLDGIASAAPAAVRHLPTQGWTAALLVAWACVIVELEQGKMPLGAFPFLPFAQSLPVALIGWGGVVLPVVAQRTRHRALYAAGLAFLTVTWAVAFAFVEDFGLVLTGLPFLYLAISQLQMVTIGREELRRGGGRALVAR